MSHPETETKTAPAPAKVPNSQVQNPELLTDHLSEDLVQIPSQKYALISIVSPTSRQEFSTCALKIRGVFVSLDDANHHAKKVAKSDPNFDVFVVEMYKWLPIPPDLEHIEDTQYQDDQLNAIIQGHKEHQMLAKEHFEQQKREKMENPDKVLEPALTITPIEDPDMNTNTDTEFDGTQTQTFASLDSDDRQLLT
eukprot:265988-Prorocentrum_minimum.AAC.4